jgi:translation initiation factor IF-3
VKVTLRFRGREMAHQEFGFKQVQNFIKDLIPYGHPDAPPKLIGKGINVMLSPLPRNKRAKNPNAPTGILDEERRREEVEQKKESDSESQPTGRVPTNASEQSNFGQTPFAEVNLKGR